MKKYSKFIYPLVLIVLIFTWFKYYRLEIDPNKSKLFRYLILKENQQIEMAWVLFYSYPNNYFYLFEIDPQTQVRTSSGNLYESIFVNRKKLKKNLNQLYKLDSFDEEIILSDQNAINLLKKFGGTPYFNRHSSFLPFGEVYIHELNYQKFIDGIENIYRKRDEVLGIWMNLLIGSFDRIPSDVLAEILLKNLYKNLTLKINYTTFKKLLEPLQSEGKITEQIYFSFDKINLEERSQINSSNQKQTILTPYQRGKYDYQKIIQKLNYILSGDWKKNLYPISIQIKNHTPINRLAARTAGYLRLRRLNVIEYTGSTSFLDRSVLLDLSFHPKKRKYIKTTSKVDSMYYLFDYREKYDFALYLGGDFFGISTNNNR